MVGMTGFEPATPSSRMMPWLEPFHSKDFQDFYAIL
jgi:hypothetical protein